MMLKAVGWLSLPLLLSACGTTAEIHDAGLDAFAPRDMARSHTYQAAPGLTNRGLLDPHVYMDDDATPRWFLMTERPIR